MKHILITGSTGILGSFCVKYLLENTDLVLYCLVRANSKEEGLKRQMFAMNPYGVLTNRDVLNRLYIIVGDVEKENLGINDEDLQGVIKNIDCVIHMAANTSFFADDATLEKTNVKGVENVISLVNLSDKAKLIYTSSYSVYGRNIENRKFTEDDFDIGQSFDGFPYAKSKYLSEKAIRSKMNDSSRYIILRPGNILGDSQTGRFPFYVNRGNDIFYNQIKTVTETKISPKYDFLHDMTPVDYIAKSIKYILTSDSLWARTFHLFNPAALSNDKIIGLIKKAGYKIDLIESDKYYELLMANKIMCHGVPYSSITTRMFSLYYRTFVGY